MNLHKTLATVKSIRRVKTPWIRMAHSIPKTQKVCLIEENSASTDVIKYVDYETPQITNPDDIIVKNKYAGINFIEGYFRKGVYPAKLPFIFGREGSGVVAAVGDNVTSYKPGDKIAFMGAPNFTQYTKLSSKLVSTIKLPESTTDEKLAQYAAVPLQGLTALTFITEAYHVKKGDYILVWAAAGGVGRLLTQLAAQRGAHVIALASSAEKLDLVKELGAEYVINYKTEDVVAKVLEITGGVGVAASFDSVGKNSWDISVKATARKGTIVSYGNASGVVPPIALTSLSPKNLKVVRPVVTNYVITQEEWDFYTKDLFSLVDSGKLSIDISKVYPLSEYKQAVDALESGTTTGKLLLEIPQ